MNSYIYVQAGNVNQCNPQDADEVLVSFRYVKVSAYSEEGAYVAGQKHQWTAEETGFDERTTPFMILNDMVIPV